MEEIVEGINKIIWSPALIIVLLGAGLYFTIRTRCIQIRRLGLMAKLLIKGDSDKSTSSISSFQAFCIALSGRVGTGNIVGVATAIAYGGPGAVFWMWITAFLGASTAFTESTLAQIYNFKSKKGLCGGPASYIKDGLKIPLLGTVFAVLAIVGYGMFLVLLQSNNAASAFSNSFAVSPLLIGILMAVLLGLVIIGGAKRIADVATIVTPFMAIVYIIMAIIIICANIQAVPAAFTMIFEGAFGINPLAGGILGNTIAMGVKRGLFSNEAGQGGGAIVSASANVKHPAQQGLVQGFSVYVDTLLVCTATALMILCTGKYNVFDSNGEMIYCSAPELGANYVSYTQNAIDTVFSGFGSVFVTVALSFFVFTTLMAYCFYAESSFAFLFEKNEKKQKIACWIYRFLMLILVVVGACASSNTAWGIGDIGIGLTTWINILALLILFPKALNALKDYEDSLS
ncbi:MAG: alanine:cation symporter family protein [Bacteroidales bacterium]|nr:alanine:cation symporter family protein [Bacteroidales bacterium]